MEGKEQIILQLVSLCFVISGRFLYHAKILPKLKKRRSDTFISKLLAILFVKHIPDVSGLTSIFSYDPGSFDVC